MNYPGDGARGEFRGISGPPKLWTPQGYRDAGPEPAGGAVRVLMTTGIGYVSRLDAMCIPATRRPGQRIEATGGYKGGCWCWKIMVECVERVFCKCHSHEAEHAHTTAGRDSSGHALPCPRSGDDTARDRGAGSGGLLCPQTRGATGGQLDSPRMHFTFRSAL